MVLYFTYRVLFLSPPSCPFFPCARASLLAVCVLAVSRPIRVRSLVLCFRLRVFGRRPQFLVSGCGLEQFIDMGADASYPLWAISSVKSGGVDYSTDEVGQVCKNEVVSSLKWQ